MPGKMPSRKSICKGQGEKQKHSSSDKQNNGPEGGSSDKCDSVLHHEMAQKRNLMKQAAFARFHQNKE